MIGNLPIPELVPVDVLDLEAFLGRWDTDEAPAVHGQAARSKMRTAARAPHDDVVSLSDEIEDLQSKVGEGLADVVEDTAGTFSSDRSAVVPGVLREVVDGGIDRAPVQAVVMRGSLHLLIGFFAGCVVAAAAVSLLGDWAWSFPGALAGVAVALR